MDKILLLLFLLVVSLCICESSMKLLHARIRTFNEYDSIPDLRSGDILQTMTFVKYEVSYIRCFSHDQCILSYPEYLLKEWQIEMESKMDIYIPVLKELVGKCINIDFYKDKDGYIY